MSKTTMQELIEWMNENEQVMFEDGNIREVYCLQRVIAKATELLEKEKQQIVNAASEGYQRGYIGSMNWTSEKYFVETYHIQ